MVLFREEPLRETSVWPGSQAKAVGLGLPAMISVRFVPRIDRPHEFAFAMVDGGRELA